MLILLPTFCAAFTKTHRKPLRRVMCFSASFLKLIVATSFNSIILSLALYIIVSAISFKSTNFPLVFTLNILVPAVILPPGIFKASLSILPKTTLSGILNDANLSSCKSILTSSSGAPEIFTFFKSTTFSN